MIRHLLAGALFFLSLTVLLFAQTFTGVSIIGVKLGAQAGTGDVVGPSSSVDSEIALFSGTTGKLIKRATGSGLVKITSGVLGTQTAGGVGNCVQWASGGLLADAGAPCGSGGGGGGGGSYVAGDGIGISGSTISVDTTVPAIAASGSQSLTFSTIAASACGTQTMTATGATIGDAVVPAWPTTLADGLVGRMTVTATDTISVHLCKITTGSASVSGLTFGYQIIRSR